MAQCCVFGAEDPRELARRFPWLRLILGLFVAGQTMVLGLAINLSPPDSETTRLVLQIGMLVATVAVMAMLGGPMLVDALRALRRGAVSMELFFLICVLGTFALSCQSLVRGHGPVYFDVVAILLIVYGLGRAVSQHSRRRALLSARQLTEALATARREDGALVEVDQLLPGDRIVVKGGELIPVDGTIADGTAFIRETPFTGEWIPATRGPGEAVIAGTACEDGPLVIAVSRAGRDRRFARIASLVEEARQAPGSLERKADRFVRWFLPIVLLVSAGAGWYWGQRDGLQEGLFHALAVLLVACPCAAGLATPLVVWTVLGRMARDGLVLRGGHVVERLASAKSVVFDKTGTLGAEQLTVEAIDTSPAPAEAAATLATLRAVEEGRLHPVAAALRSVPVPADAPAVTVARTRTLPGRGIESWVRRGDEERRFRVVRDDAGTPGYLELRIEEEGELKARARLKERLRTSAGEALTQTRALGLPVRVLTGDGAAPHVERMVDTESGLTPEQKLARVQEMDRPLFVGDGFNDAAAMAAAHTSIALASGSDVAVETADATLHGGDLAMVPHAVALSRHAVRVVQSNLLWAVLYNFTGIALAATGYLHPVAAALLMGCSSAIVAVRSFRLGSAPLPIARAEPEIDPDAVPAPWRRLLWVHALSLLGMAAVTAVLADLGPLGWTAMLLGAAAGTWALARWWTKAPPWLDMTLGMVTAGGFGMAVGWWADLGFDMGLAATCPCAEPSGTMLFTWMNAGMLLLGVPAMYLLRHTWHRFRFRKWCCGGMLVFGVPGMVLGMIAASTLLHGAALDLSGSTLVLLDMGAMLLGMVIGMLVPHALGHAFLQR
ncbi:MAG: heavy metal translocating P-type ATPase [Planctomycetota bacterium]